ncbi:EEF1A lysine methyltransferase 2, partial [Lecanoromycetidae sp. Uapishka_2]
MTTPKPTHLEPSLDKDETTFLDLGTGNGEMLFLLREEGGFKGRVVGVDYSHSSIQLCRQIATKRGYALGPSFRGGMEFTQWDIMNMKPRPQWIEGWDVVLDKGTFDAVSLSAEMDGEGRRICEGYRDKVEGLVKKSGLLLVTSCNWTEEELRGWFEGADLEVMGRVEYPVFKFGGMTGQSVCSVCFKKKS